MVTGREFRIKQAALRGTYVVSIDKLSLTVTKGGRKDRIDFAGIKDIYVNVRPDEPNLGLEIVPRTGSTIRVQTTAVLTGKANVLDFYRATGALLLAYSNARPDAEVYFGRSRRANMALLAIAAVFGVIGWLMMAFWDGVVTWEDWAVLAFIPLALGWYSFTRYRAWKEPPLYPAGQLAAEFARSADPLVS